MVEGNDRVPRILQGALVLVTGAGQGNGRAIARGVSAAGARVIVTDIRQDTVEQVAAEIKAGGGEAHAFQLDVTDAAACAELAQRVERDIGMTSVLVANAGIVIRETIDSPRAHENWRKVMDVNVNGVFNVVHAWLPALRKTRGTIINIASIGSFVGLGGILGYAPSKGAVKLFTQALVRDLAPDGIRVNAIAPGVVATPMTADTREHPERLAGFLSRTPLGRVAEPEELVGPVVFLASSMASYVNGAILPVDGGYLAV